MHENSIRKLLKLACATLIVAGLAITAHAANCSSATVKGDWALTLNGTVLLPTSPVPVAAVLRTTLNLDGTVTGTENRNLGGQYADETLTGTFLVNSNCTGSATVSFYEEGQLVRTSVLSTVFDENSKQVRMVQKSLTLPNGAVIPVVVLVEGRKQ